MDLNVGEEDEKDVRVEMKLIKRRESLRRMMWSKAGSGQRSDGVGVLIRLMRSNLAPGCATDATGLGYGEHWRIVTFLGLCGCCLSISFQFRFGF
ncbi:Phospholipase A I [Euphorbia peplus]|nr:Phospholipase A I [Euphorbia peplus]